MALLNGVCVCGGALLVLLSPRPGFCPGVTRVPFLLPDLCWGGVCAQNLALFSFN